jgi:hypothetical protein
MSPEEVIFAEYRGKRILLDANLLLLYSIGTFERTRVSHFKRTSSFTEQDFELLAGLLPSFRTVVTTPHILTEVSNLANSLPSDIKPLWSEHFAQQVQSFLEVFQPAAELTRISTYKAFGLADSAIHHASHDTLILTEDFRLSGYLRTQGVATLNFRDLALMSKAVRN